MKRPIVNFHEVLKFFGLDPANVFPKLNQEDKINILRDYYYHGRTTLSNRLSFQI